MTDNAYYCEDGQISVIIQPRLQTVSAHLPRRISLFIGTTKLYITYDMLESLTRIIELTQEELKDET